MKEKFIIGAIVVGSLLVVAGIVTLVLVFGTPSDVGTMPPSTTTMPPTPSTTTMPPTPSTTTMPPLPPSTIDYRKNRTNRGGEKFDDVDYSPERGVYPADIKHWVDLTDDGPREGEDQASQIVESKEECAALFDEYNANRALNNNDGFPRALAFTVSPPWNTELRNSGPQYDLISRDDIVMESEVDEPTADQARNSCYAIARRMKKIGDSVCGVNFFPRAFGDFTIGGGSGQITQNRYEAPCRIWTNCEDRTLQDAKQGSEALIVSEEVNDLDTLVCRLQDRLVVDLDDIGRIKEDSNSQVGRRFCADYVGGGSDEDSYLNCPAFQLESESDAGIQVPLCAWDVQDETCVEFTPVHHSLAPDDGVLSELQGNPFQGMTVQSCVPPLAEALENPILCPEGTVARAYEVASGQKIDRIKLGCVRYRSNGTLGSEVYSSGTLGDGPSPTGQTRRCSGQSALVGTKDVRYGTGPGDFMYAIGEGACQPIQNIRNGTENDLDYESLAILGRVGGVYQSDPAFCPPGSVVTGMIGATKQFNVFDNHFPCRYYWNCRKLEEETTMGSIWDVDYPYFEDQ